MGTEEKSQKFLPAEVVGLLILLSRSSDVELLGMRARVPQLKPVVFLSAHMKTRSGSMQAVT